MLPRRIQPEKPGKETGHGLVDFLLHEEAVGEAPVVAGVAVEVDERDGVVDGASDTVELCVFDAADEDGLQENSRVVGKRLKDGFNALAKHHQLIGDVRGMGLMLGVEMVRDRKTKEPAKQETLALLEAAREMGILVGKGGLDGNVLRIKPPMCITAEDADFTLDVLDRALGLVEG